MKTAGDILAARGPDVWTVSPKATVFDALKLMSEKNVGALLVKRRGGPLTGIITERDYARKVVLLGKSSLETPVEDIMTPASRMISVQPDATLEACMTLMTVHHVRHLPVFAGDYLRGIISSRDVIETLIAAQNAHIDNLKDLSEALFVQTFDDNIAGGKG